MVSSDVIHSWPHFLLLQSSITYPLLQKSLIFQPPILIMFTFLIQLVGQSIHSLQLVPTSLSIPFAMLLQLVDQLSIHSLHLTPLSLSLTFAILLQLARHFFPHSFFLLILILLLLLLLLLNLNLSVCFLDIFLIRYHPLIHPARLSQRIRSISISHHS